MRELATRPAVRDAATRGELSSMSPELAHWLTGHAQVTSVGIVDLDGWQVASGQDAPAPPDGAMGRDWFQGALATGAPYLGAPGSSPLNGRPRLPYAVPVTDASGTLRGVLVASISLESL